MCLCRNCVRCVGLRLCRARGKRIQSRRRGAGTLYNFSRRLVRRAADRVRNGEGMDEASGTLRFYTKVHNSTALWLGASHQYAINEFEPGGEMMVYHANRLARERSASSSCLSVGLGTRIQAQGHRGKISLVMRPGGYNGIDARRGDRLPEARRAVHILSVLAPR